MNPRFYGKMDTYGDKRSIVILSPYIDTEEKGTIEDINFDKALVVDTDSINNDIAEQLYYLIDNPEAENASYKTLMQYLQTKHFRDGASVLNSLHSMGAIEAASVDTITVGNTPHSLRDVNNIIREERQKSDASLDTDEYHRRQSKQYQEELDKSDRRKSQPVENDFSDSNPVNPDDEFHIETSREVERFSKAHPESTASYVAEHGEELSSDMVTSDSTSSAVMPAQSDVPANSRVLKSHENIMEQIQGIVEQVDGIKAQVTGLETVLSPQVTSSLLFELEQYGKVSGDDVKDTLIELLSSHYQNVDADYIRKNLNNAEKRKGKNS